MTIQKLVYIIIYENADFGQLARKKTIQIKWTSNFRSIFDFFAAHFSGCFGFGVIDK